MPLDARRTREDFAVDWIIVRLASRCHISLSVSGYPFLSSSKAVEAIAAKRWRSCFFGIPDDAFVAVQLHV